MTSSIIKRPEHEAIYERVKELVLFGGLVPGQPLTIHGVAETLGAGITPVREAIRRLTAEGALDTLPNRRIETPQMNVDRLMQIRLVRLLIEPELAANGAKRIKPKEIDNLQHIDRQVDDAIETGDVTGYLRANYQFHFALYAAANQPILERIAESLWLQIAPAQRVICGRAGTANLQDRHVEITTALRMNDHEKVRMSMQEDILQGLDLVAQSLTEDAPFETGGPAPVG